MAVQNPTAYTLSRAYPARAFGVLALVTGVLLMGWAVVDGVQSAGWLSGLLFVAVLLGGMLSLAAGVLLVVPTALLKLDDDGFAVRWIRSAGVSRGSWSEVSGVATRPSEHGPVMVLLRGESGGRTQVPLALLDAPPVEVEQEVRRRLDRAHGLTPLA